MDLCESNVLFLKKDFDAAIPLFENILQRQMESEGAGASVDYRELIKSLILAERPEDAIRYL